MYIVSAFATKRSAETVDTAHERNGVDASIRSEGRGRFGGQTWTVSVAICSLTKAMSAKMCFYVPASFRNFLF